MRKYELFLQDSPNDCGPACLASVLKFHGVFITPIDLVKRMELTRGGVSNFELAQVSLELGMQSKTIVLALEQFNRLKEPAIAYVEHKADDLSHWVVVFETREDKLYIGDPAKGKAWVTKEVFAETYAGRLMIFKKLPTFEPQTLSQSYLHNFANFIAQYKWRIVQSLAVGLTASVIAFGLIYLSKHFIDEILPQKELNIILAFTGIYLLAKLLNLGIRGFNEVFAVYLRNIINKVLSETFFDRTMNLEKRHIDNREMGDFLQQFMRIDWLTQGIATYYSGFILVVFGILIKTGFLIALYDGGLVSIILAILILNASIGFLFTRMMAEQSNRQSLINSRLNTALIGSLEDIRVVRVFNATDWLQKTYSRLLGESLDLLRSMTRLRVFGRSAAELLNFLGEAAIFAICGAKIISGAYTLGDFLLFLTFAQGLAAESIQFPNLIQSFQTQLRAFARLQAILELNSEPTGKEWAPSEYLEIEFENVTFGYHKASPVLKDISFKLDSGSTTAIVGESGSGKSTIMNLIMGFYRPQSGRILVNGVDLKDIDLDKYRKEISAVFQNTPIFNKNIYNNIALGNPDISEEDVRDVAEMLGANEFIEQKPGGYKYLIYPGALSGGQAQRIGILRAMCKPFQMLLLDEATSNLDSLTEERIVQGVETLCSNGQTRVIIAHRLSTVMRADQILVMRDGAIIESGDHQSLVSRAGYYMELIQRQYEVNLTPSPSLELQPVPVA